MLKCLTISRIRVTGSQGAIGERIFPAASYQKRMINDMATERNYEWIHIKDNVATLGITDEGIDRMGEITHVCIPKINTYIKIGEEYGYIDHEYYPHEWILEAPVSGVIIDRNHKVGMKPEIMNNTLLMTGRWLIKMKIDDRKGVYMLSDGIELIKEKLRWRDPTTIQVPNRLLVKME